MTICKYGLEHMHRFTDRKFCKNTFTKHQFLLLFYVHQKSLQEISDSFILHLELNTEEFFFLDVKKLGFLIQLIPHMEYLQHNIYVLL